jgi:hypothetical protein
MPDGTGRRLRLLDAARRAPSGRRASIVRGLGEQLVRRDGAIELMRINGVSQLPV